MFDKILCNLLIQKEEYLKLKSQVVNTLLEKSFEYIICEIDKDLIIISNLNKIMDVNENMKPVFKEFWCPQCGNIRFVYVDGICDYCRNVSTLEKLTKQRKLKHQLDNGFFQIELETCR